MTNYPGQAPAANDPGISNLSPARRATETELVWLHTDTGTRTQRLQACGSRAKAICEHLADRKPLAPPALRCDSSISVPLLRLQACSARRRAWGVWWAGRQVRACVDGGWTWVAGTESDGHETDHGGGLRKESLEEERS